MDFHPKVRDKMSFHHLLPGYNYALQDPQDGFYARTTCAFQANVQTVTIQNSSVQSTINVSGDGAFLDPDNSHIQCIVTYPTAQYQQTVAEGADAAVGSDMGGYVMDQLASSLVKRMLIKCGGQQLCDLNNFADYHHIEMLAKDNQSEQMDFFSECAGILPSITGSIKYDPVDALKVAELKKYISLYGSQQILPAAGIYESMDELIQERLKEDVKRAMKCWKLTTAIGDDQTTHNLNCFYAPRDNTEMDTYKILLKLSDIPCFYSKQYFPLFAVGGPLQITIDWNDYASCHHLIGFERGALSPNISNYNTYTIYKLEAICNFIYPKPDFLERYMIDVVSAGEGYYKSRWVDWSSQNQTTNQANILFNVSLARLTDARFIKKELNTTGAAAHGEQNPSSKRYTLQDAAAIGGVLYRGNKWYSPFGTDLTSLYTVVNGITYPLANGSVMINEHLLKQQTEDAMGKLWGLADPRRYFFDQQVVAFSYKKDTHSSPLQDVSGINTANNNQVQFRINNSGSISANQQPIIHGFFYGEMVIQFTPQGALQLFR